MINVGQSRCEYAKGLYIVATPIGNLEDITIRALHVLKMSDTIVCEDTRVTKKLFQHFDICNNNYIRYDDYSNIQQRQKIIELLTKGQMVSLVCDAGTPLIADPGYKLVQEVIANNIYCTCIPGASALISALTLSGLESDKFMFIGFLPRKVTDISKIIINLPANTTIICYESPHRIKKTLLTIVECKNIKSIVIARELTKKFEELIRGTPAEIKPIIDDIKNKGEFVILMRTNDEIREKIDLNNILNNVNLANSMNEISMKHTKDIAHSVSLVTGVTKREIYNEIIKKKQGNKK